LISTLAAEGGLLSSLWAGPEKFSRGMLSGETAITDTVRLAPYSLRLGFCHAIDLVARSRYTLSSATPRSRSRRCGPANCWAAPTFSPKGAGKSSAFVGPRAAIHVEGEDYGVVIMHQRGVLRPFEAKELSDGTLRCLLLVTALLSPRS
jgi:predicted ATPase